MIAREERDMNDFRNILEEEMNLLLEGSGMRVLILEDEDEYTAELIMPLEFKVTYSLEKTDEVLAKMRGMVSAVLAFKERYMDGALDPDTGSLFLGMPGVFSFLTDEPDDRCMRLICIIMEEAFGRRNIFSVTLNEDNACVHTRAGRFYVKYTAMNDSIREEIALMRRHMRLPLRKRSGKR